MLWRIPSTQVQDGSPGKHSENHTLSTRSRGLCKATWHFSPIPAPLIPCCPMCGLMHPPESSLLSKSPWAQTLPSLPTMCPITHGRAGALPAFRAGISFPSRKVFSGAGAAQNPFTVHVLDIQLTRCVSYVPNGVSRVKVLQARANAIFSQDKVTVLLETVRSTIKPIDQPLELVLQRDTEIETKIAWPFSLQTQWVKACWTSYLPGYEISEKELCTDH